MDVAISVFDQASDVNLLRGACERLRTGQEAVIPLRVQSAQGSIEYRVAIESPPELVIAGAAQQGAALA